MLLNIRRKEKYSRQAMHLLRKISSLLVVSNTNGTILVIQNLPSANAFNLKSNWIAC